MSETTQLGSRNETTQLVSRNETTQLVSRNETTQLCTAVDRLQPPATAYNRLQPPVTACNRLHRLQPPAPPATACTACTAFTAESAFSTYSRVFSDTGLELMTCLPSSDTLTTGLPQTRKTNMDQQLVTFVEKML
ncbi:hypothetical protein TNCV_312251 [Trichonephila clavipes]|nr:hypothetical protein TNCV_312251 [Trichonephila clavipes]